MRSWSRNYMHTHIFIKHVASNTKLPKTVSVLSLMLLKFSAATPPNAFHHIPSLMPCYLWLRFERFSRLTLLASKHIVDTIVLIIFFIQNMKCVCVFVLGFSVRHIQDMRFDAMGFFLYFFWLLFQSKLL